LIAVQLRIIEPGSKGMKTMEMIKNKGLSIHPYTAIAPPDLVVGQIPRCEISPFVAQDNETFVKSRPIVEILLIRIPIVFRSSCAPLDALLPPSLKTEKSLSAAAETEPSHIVNSVDFKVTQILGKTVTDDGYRRIPDLFVDRRRIREKKQIRVQIGDHRHIGMVLQDEKGERGGAGKIVLQQLAILPCPQELRISTFEILDGD
jgi:hypothetical protein